MTPIAISKDQIPLWQGATGKFEAQVDVPSPANPLPVSSTAIASLSFSADGKTAIGSDVTLGVSASTSFKLAALFKEETGADPELVTELVLAPALRDDNLLLALDLGGKADVSAAGSYTYSVLTVGASLEAGADGRLVQTRSYPREKPAGEMLLEFFKDLAFPGTIAVPPPPGEVTSLEFGGYLNFGINASAGYQLKGTHDFQKIGDLSLSEHYQASITGKLSVKARLAGRFSVKVQAAEDKNWAQVSVTRQRSNELQIAADLNVSAKVDTQDLPTSGKEFLGALLGVCAKNWINQADSILQQAADIHTPQDLLSKLDSLSKTYVEKYVGKAVDQFLPQDVTDLMARFKKVVDSYQNLDNSAITLFDRYLDVADTKLMDVLNEVNGLANWDQFRGEVDPMLWNVVQQLTGGNILDFILQKSLGLANLQAAAQKVVDLIKEPAHEEIRSVIALAKKEFGLDPIVDEIAEFDSPDALKTQLSKVAQGAVERIIGKAVGQINDDDFKAITTFVQEVKKAEDGFFAKFDKVLQEAASQSFSLDVGLAYSRADESKALIDVDIRLLDDDGTPNVAGRNFMRAAGLGDFGEILAKYDPNVVRLRDGHLTHSLSTSSGLTINIAGWHDNFKYSDMRKVLVNSDQQIRATPNGMINVFTTVDVSVAHDQTSTMTRKTSKHEQEMHTNFTLRFLAESRNADFNPRDRAYLLDVIKGQSAIYTSTLTDSATTPDKLDHLLAFAKTLGLNSKGATQQALQPILKQQNGNYGTIEASYRVQFSEVGLANLFDPDDLTPDATRTIQIRRILRQIVVANYAGDPSLGPVAWLYCSDTVRNLAVGNTNFLHTDSVLQNALASGVVGPEARAAVSFGNLQPTLFYAPVFRTLVSNLFSVEQTLIESCLRLQALVRQGHVPLSELENCANGFGKALNTFEGMTQISDHASSPVFAVFDGLIRNAILDGTPASASTLALTLGPPEPVRHLIFQ